MLRDAAWGRGSWEAVCGHLAGAIPGSVAAIANYDPVDNTLRSVFVHGVAPEYVESYRDHYATRNPWIDFVKTTPGGNIFVSERDMPARSFAHTEFYNDWLKPQGNMDAATGIRLVVGPRDAVHVAWHYAAERAPEHDPRATVLMQRLRPLVEAALRDAAVLREAGEHDTRIAAVIEHVGGPAFVVDRLCAISESNQEAEKALRQGGVVQAAGNVLVVRDAPTQRWLEETVIRLCDGRTLSTLTRVFEHENRIFKVSVSKLPNSMLGGTDPLLVWRPRVLVVIQRLVGGTIHVDTTALRVAFGLSGAEIRLCELLINGHSLTDAARALGLSDGTVRQRVKMIFHKTHTHRQGELVALLNRFSRSE